MQGSASLAPPDKDPEDVARSIVDVVNTPFEKRPCRVHVEPSRDRAAAGSAVSDKVKADIMQIISVGDLLVSVDEYASLR